MSRNCGVLCLQDKPTSDWIHHVLAIFQRPPPSLEEVLFGDQFGVSPGGGGQPFNTLPQEEVDNSTGGGGWQLASKIGGTTHLQTMIDSLQRDLDNERRQSENTRELLQDSETTVERLTEQARVCSL